MNSAERINCGHREANSSKVSTLSKLSKFTKKEKKEGRKEGRKRNGIH